MSQQSTLTDKNFYPLIDEAQSDEERVSLQWDRTQTLVCGLCGGTMKRGAPGTSFENHTDINYSCRNSHCGGSAAVGGSSLTVLVEVVKVKHPDGEMETVYELKDGNTTGMPLKKNAREFMYDEDAGSMVHPEHFDVEQWAELEE
jgi:hypothetical protein